MKKSTTAYGAVRPTWDKYDCSIRALAVAANCSYNQASAIFSSGGRKLKKGTDVLLTKTIHETWLLMKPVDGIQGWQLAAFIAAHPNGRYILHKRSHAFAVVDGIVHDWENTTNPRTEVIRAWEVTSETEAKIEKTRGLFE